MGLLEDGSKSEKIYWRIMGATAAIGAIFGFFTVEYSYFKGIEIILDGRLVDASIYAFAAMILVTFLSIPVMFIGIAVESALQHRNPFNQGISFIFYVCLGAAVIDFVFLGSQMVIFPVIHFLTTGDFGPTIWGCEDWIVDDDYGGYCNDQK